MVSPIVPYRPRPAGSSGCGADTEHNGRGKRYKWQYRRREGNRGSCRAGNDRGQWGVNRVYEPEPAADECSGENEAEETGSKCDNDLQHSEFPE